MKFTQEEISSLAGDQTIKDNLPKGKEYDWIDLVGIPQRPIGVKNNLYFATHSEGVGGWDNGFDRRTQAFGVSRDLGWDIVAEETLDIGESGLLSVRNLDIVSERLYKAAREGSNPYVVGVTGSVGKTTTVAFLEHMLTSTGRNVARFYSKRLTPLSVMCHFINRVEAETEFVVMEYSAYLPDHVGTLANLLPPDTAFLTNIYDTHINEGMFTDRMEIFQSKRRIKPDNTVGYLNRHVLNVLGVEPPSDWNIFDVEVPVLGLNPNLPPTVRTAELFTVGSILGRQVGIHNRDVEQAFKSFNPAEQRILTCNFQGKRIFFHGETSGGSRLMSWFETLDNSLPWMFVEEVNFADENPSGFLNLLKYVFESPKTVVLDTPNNREKLVVPAHFVSPDRFRDMLEKDAEGYIVYHKALSTRSRDFDPQTYLARKW